MKLSFRLRFLLVVTVLPLWAAAQSMDSLYNKAEYDIAMRDSVHLHTTVYTPKSAVKAPILIIRTPYGTGPYGAGNFSHDFGRPYMQHYFKRGYIVVMQDVRGRNKSEGEFEHVRPVGYGETDESTDSYDTVDWLVKHVANNNGCVGFMGNSYPGYYAFMGALCGHPAVKAVSPQAPVTDWFMGDDVHHNGALMLLDATGFLSSMQAPKGHTPTERMPSSSVKIVPDARTFFLEKYPTRGDVLKLISPNYFWSDMAAHPDYDAWWKVRDTRRAAHNVRPAMLVVGGTYDAEDCFGAWNLFRAIHRQNPSTPCHLVVGPWSHGAWRLDGTSLGDFRFGDEASSDYYVYHYEAPFFDYYLRGIGTDTLPVASVFTSGDNRWHGFGEWLPRQAQPMTYYLQADGKLSTTKPTAKKSATLYVSDPSNPVPYYVQTGGGRPKEYMVADQRFLAGRKDVVSFVSEPLTAPMTLVGPVDVKLEVALSTTDANFIVKLIDVYPDGGEHSGYQMLVRVDVMPGRYRTDFAHPRPFKPSEITAVPMRMPDIAHTFQAGHRVMIQVQSSWFPLVERNPQQYVDMWRCTATDFVPCRIELLHQRSAACAVTVYNLK